MNYYETAAIRRVRKIGFRIESDNELRETHHPCVYAHFDCSRREGGPCSDEQASREEDECPST